MSRTHIHPAFHTSFENQEMFGWVKPQPTPSHTLILDGCQKFTFEPSGNQVKWTRQARNGYKRGQWQVTGRDTLPIQQARNLYKQLLKGGASQGLN